MSTISKATIIENTMPIMQGDIYKNVKYSYIDSEGNEQRYSGPLIKKGNKCFGLVTL